MKILIGLFLALLALVALIVLLLLVISFFRVGGVMEYSQEGIKVWLRVGPFQFQVLPREPKKKPKKKEKPPQQPSENPSPKRGGRIQKFLPYVSLALEAVEKMLGRIRIDELWMDFISGGEAADAALTFGGLNAFLGSLWPALCQVFGIQKYRIRTAVDYQEEDLTVYLYASFSALLGTLGLIALKYGLRALKLRNKLVRKAKKNTAKAGN